MTRGSRAESLRAGKPGPSAAPMHRAAMGAALRVAPGTYRFGVARDLPVGKAPSAPRRPRMLLVERTMMQDRFELFLARNGQEALDAVQALMPDVEPVGEAELDRFITQALAPGRSAPQ